MSFNSDLKQAFDKKKQIETYISDISKLYNAGNQLYHRGVGSTGELMKLAYEGVERIAGLTSHSYIGQYLSYHKIGFNALSGMIKAKEMIEFIEKWQSAFEKRANELETSANEVFKANSFAYSMMNGDGALAKNLPPQFLIYYEYAKDYNDAFDNFQEKNFKNNWDSATRTQELKSIPELSKPYAIGMKDREEQLGLVILMRARDVASAYMYFANEFSEFEKAGEKANKMLKKLQQSKGSGDVIASKGAEYKAQLDLVNSNENSDINHHLLYFSGDWKETSSYKKADKAIKKLHDLSHKWNQWAYNVKQDIHLQSY
ncbi:hypothetical protein NBRC116592_04230 [Colwellia sp. KU-HH00111]|uniref:hypothetical protein n=1 Tax=Colwellia sp. KU-HH00111 TaxID=3127652 RepID=UPI00310AE0D6